MGFCEMLVWLNPLYALITASALLPSALSLIFLSFLGYGAETYLALSGRAYLSPYYFSTFATLGVVMYLFESSSWRGPLRLLHLFLAVLTLAHMGLWMLVRIEDHPTLPLLFVMLITPAWLSTVQWFTAPLTRQRHSFLAMRNGMVLASAALLTIWLFWIYDTGSYWSPGLKRSYAQRIHCPMMLPAAAAVCNVSEGTRYKGGLAPLVHQAGAKAADCCDQCETWNLNASRHVAANNNNNNNNCTHWTHVAFPTNSAGADKYGWGATCFLKGGAVPAAGPTVDDSAKDFTSGTTILPSAAVVATAAASAGKKTQNKKEEEVCQGAFILYMSPFLLAVMNLVLAFILQSVTASSSTKPAAAGGEEQDDGKQSGADQLVKLVQRVLIVLMVGTYFNSVVSTGSYRIASAINGVLVICFCILGTVIAAAMKWPDLQEKILSVPIIKKLAGSATSIWLKAFFVLFLGPLFVINVFFMLLNHLLKKQLPCMFGKAAGGGADDKEAELERQGKAEEESRRGLADEFSMSAMVEWPWNAVLRASITVGVVLMSLQVVIGKAVTLFLAWLNAYLSEGYSTNEVVVIFFAIGLTMFLLPPVPGVPVYLAGGVILTNALQKDHGFWTAAFITSCICFGIKLVAIVCQQKGIGALCGKFVAVRSAVSINSMLMRAIKHILSGPVDLASVCILCGGPDWPTSVTTGILGLSLCQMLRGSLPVFFVILPTCMAGALQLRAAEGGSWAAMAAMMLTCCGVLQSGAGLGAMHFIEETIAKHEQELKAMPNDEAVLKLDQISEAAAKERASETQWKKVPALHKLSLVLGSLLMSCSIYIVYLFPLECFEKFEVTSSIERDLGGDMWSIVKPKGWDALYLCFTAMLLMWFNGRWVGRQMREFNKLSPDEKAAREQKSEGGDNDDDGDDDGAGGDAPAMTKEDSSKKKKKAKMDKTALTAKKQAKGRQKIMV